jgi:hypothetical protein
LDAEIKHNVLMLEKLYMMVTLLEGDDPSLGAIYLEMRSRLQFLEPTKGGIEPEDLREMYCYSTNLI